MITITPEYTEQLMRSALELAEFAAKNGEVPIGAVVSYKGEIIAKAANEVEKRKEATAHAEILAIEQASQKLSNWRLEECILCVTVEPCTMCFGAIENARIPVVIYGASEPRTGALGSRYDLGSNQDRIRVISGVLAEECQQLVRGFFKQQRVVKA